MGQAPWIRLTFWRVFLLIIIPAGMYASIVRFGIGLGAATNLSDRVPWGLWIGLDDLGGVALAAGAFTIAAGVYILGLHHYRPILRATILTALIGYAMAGASVLYDVGQPLRIWHPIIMWNMHSPMFLVAICVILYTGVLALEFSPVVFEWLKLERAHRFLHMLTPPLVVVGLVIATLHQSALGTLFVIVPNKLHPLWYTPLLPVLFYISAIAVGLAMVIVESGLCHRCFGAGRHDDILTGISKAIPITLGIYLLLRAITLATQWNINDGLFNGTLESSMFGIEMVIGLILPILLFSSSKIRSNDRMRFTAALLVVFGTLLNRVNVSMIGLARYVGYSYKPSVLEILTTVFITTLGISAFCLAVKYLPVFPDRESRTHIPVETPIRGTVIASRFIVLVTFIALLIAYSQSCPPPAIRKNGPLPLNTASFHTLNVSSSQLKLPTDYRYAQSDLSPGKVTFSHKTHVARNFEACSNCHPLPYPMVSPSIKPEAFHGGKRMSGCSTCHDGIAAFSVDSDCSRCHSAE